MIVEISFKSFEEMAKALEALTGNGLIISHGRTKRHIRLGEIALILLDKAEVEYEVIND